jgi:3-deoxy-7-phosphoheptulonate synthase
MAKAAIAAGADALMIEVHLNPAEALSDGPQSLKPEQYQELMQEMLAVSQVSNCRGKVTTAPGVLAAV